MSSEPTEKRLARDLPTLADKIGALPPGSFTADTPSPPSPQASPWRVVMVASAAAILLAVAVVAWVAKPEGTSTERVATEGVEEPASGYEARISIDKFSGMENPSWPLSDEELSSILKLVDQLPTEAAQDVRPGLGFRGVTVAFQESGDLAILEALGAPGNQRGVIAAVVAVAWVAALAFAIRDHRRNRDDVLSEEALAGVH